MKLSHEQLKGIALGAAYVDIADSKTVFHRFTKKQEKLYQNVKSDFYNKTFATSCVRLEFETDSSTLFIKTQITPRSSRRFFAHDIFIDDKLCGTLNGSQLDAESSTISKSFALGKKGIAKKVRINLPWSYSSDIIELSLDYGATLTPIKKNFKMLCFGDSITQGYDSSTASGSYASQLTTSLDAETRNKGIGGEIFRPELAELKDDDFDPNIITVAYGTNDWATEIPRDVFINRINRFFDALTKNYPEAKIFVISPIWRADWKSNHMFGDFSDIKEELLNATNKYANMTFIDGFDFVPHQCELFSDKYLHPNEDGFSYYADNLIKEMKKHL